MMHKLDRLIIIELENNLYVYLNCRRENPVVQL